ncbi:MAG: ABC transporter permease subunit, partial [Victivallaceae bacterium]|nr:ABC transporter permease subunit [Victivallaceae bacterium]
PPGRLAGGSLVLSWSFTARGTPLMCGYTATTAVQIFNGMTELESNPVPYALVVVMLVVSLALYALSRRALGGGAAFAVKGGSAREPVELPRVKKYLPTAAFALTAILSALPHAALILTAFSRRYYRTLLPQGFTTSHFSEALSNALVLPSIGNSLRYSFFATILALAIGAVAAFGVARWRVRGGALLDLLTMAPLAIPGIVVAFGFLSVSVKFQWAAEAFKPVENPLFLLSTAYAVRRIPYVVRAVVSGLEQTPVELEDAARNFGATSARVFFRITLPLISANLFVGGLFAFSFSMLEVSDSLLLAQKAQFFPITRALYELSQILGSGSVVAAAFGVWTMLFLATTIGAATALLGRRIGSVFKF